MEAAPFKPVTIQASLSALRKQLALSSVLANRSEGSKGVVWHVLDMFCFLYLSFSVWLRGPCSKVEGCPVRDIRTLARPRHVVFAFLDVSESLWPTWHTERYNFTDKAS